MRSDQNVGKKRAVCAVIAAIMMVALGSFFQDRWKDEIVVAVIVRGQQQDFDQLHIHFIEKYLREQNAGLTDHRFEYRIFKTNGKAYELVRAYEAIVADPRIAAVFDNSWAAELKDAAPIISESGIPVIALNADRGSVDYGDNVVFLGSDDNVPRRVSQFLKKVLGVNSPLFVAEQDYSLTQTFFVEMKSAGIAPEPVLVKGKEVNQSELDSSKVKIADSILAMKRSGVNPVVVLNVHNRWGKELIGFIDKNFDDVTIVGGAYVHSSAASSTAKSSPVTRNNKLILLTYPADSASSKVVRDYIDLPGAVRDDIASVLQPQLFIKRCLDAVSILGFAANESSATSSDRRVSRARIASVFRNSLRSGGFSNAIDSYRFDEHMIMLDDRRFELNHRGHAETYPAQVDESGNEAQNVTVGFRLLNLSNIDLRNRTFEAEFNYWVRFDRRYQDPTDRIVFTNAKSRTDQALPISSDNGGALGIRRFKSSGVFGFDPDVSGYPFDSHDLRIVVELAGTRGSASLSFDQRGVDEDRKRVANLRIAGWNITDYLVTVDKIISQPLGVIDEGDLDTGHNVRQLGLSVGISRFWPGPLISIIIPLLSMGIAAIGLLFVSNRSFTHVGEVSVGLLFAVVTYSLSFDQLTPKFIALTAADLWFYTTFVLILLIVLKVIFFNSLLLPARVRVWEAAQFSRIGVAFAAVYAAALILVAVWAFWS